MANSDNPNGLSPVKYLSGAPYNGAGNVYNVAAGDSVVINPGDPVIMTGTADANGIPTVRKATAGAAAAITGVMLTITPGEGTVLQDDPLSTIASTNQYILVSDDASVVYVVQASGTIAVTDIGQNANLLIPVSSVEGKSQTEIGSTSALATGQVKILRLNNVVDNEIGEFAKLEVLINLPTLASNSVGV